MGAVEVAELGVAEAVELGAAVMAGPEGVAATRAAEL
jgi:hypothetical protein